MNAVVAEVDPLIVMGAMAMYMGSAEAGSNPEHDRPFGIYQHHLEIAQAMLQRAGDPNGGGTETTWQSIPRVVDAVKRFNEAWIILQLQKVERATGSEERELQKVLFQLRLNASTLRGWGYQSRMVPMLEELLAPLDGLVESRLGWRPGALPQWWMAMSNLVDERLATHRATVQSALDWPIDDAWFSRVVDQFGLLPGARRDAVVGAARQDEQTRQGFVMHSSDLRAHELYRFTLDELVALMPSAVEPEVVASIMDAWSLDWGDEGGVDIGTLVLDNPVVGRPFLASGERSWHLFCGWLMLHNPFELVERLLDGEQDLFDAYMSRRAAFLEKRTAELLQQALPQATVEPSVLWQDPADAKQYENDVLALISSYAVIAEAKAGRLHPAARRGRGRALRDRVEELMVRPSEQGLRLAGTLEANQGRILFERKADESELSADADQVRRTVVIGVTLEPMAGLLPRLVDIAEAGLAKRAVDSLAYNISLPDLELIVDLLEHPSEVLHFLGRRTEIERRTFLMGDEVDLLGLYLDRGFNLGEREFQGRDILDVTGMSDPIDVWHYRREAGLPAERPRPQRTEWWEAVLSQVEDRGGPRWAEIGVSMCNLAPEDQEKFEHAMRDLQRAIADKKREPTDIVVFHNGPAQRQDVFVGLIAASPDADARARQYQGAAKTVLDRYPLERLTVLAWLPVATDLPYFALALYEAES